MPTAEAMAMRQRILNGATGIGGAGRDEYNDTMNYAPSLYAAQEEAQAEEQQQLNQPNAIERYKSTLEAEEGEISTPFFDSFNFNIKEHSALNSAWINLTATKTEKLADRRRISEITGISLDALNTSYDNELYNKAAEIAAQYEKMKGLAEFQRPDGQLDMDKVYEAMPYLADMHEAHGSDGAAEVLMNAAALKTVNDLYTADRDPETGELIDPLYAEKRVAASIAYGGKLGLIQLGEMGVGIKASVGGLISNRRMNEWERSSLEWLEAERRNTPGFSYSNPASALGGFLGSALENAPIMAIGAIGAGVGAAAAGPLGLAGAAAYTLATATSAAAMTPFISGADYLQNIEKTNRRGEAMYTPREAFALSYAQGAVESAIEVASMKAMGRAILGRGITRQLTNIYAARSANLITERAALDSTKSLLARNFDDYFRAFATPMLVETREEFLQQMSNMVLENGAQWMWKGNESEYSSAGQILRESLNAAVEAVPSVVGFGLFGVAGRAGTHALSYTRLGQSAIDSLAKREAARLTAMRTNINDRNQIRNDVANLLNTDEGLKRQSTDLSEEALDHINEQHDMLETDVDVRTMLNQEGGAELVQKIAEASNISKEELTAATAADSTGFVRVKTSTLTMLTAQLKDEERALLDKHNAGVLSSGAEAMTDAQLRKALGPIHETSVNVAKALQEERTMGESDLIDRYIEKNFKGDSEDTTRQRTLANDILRTNFNDPMSELRRRQTEVNKNLDERIAPYVAERKKGMGQGVSVVNVDESGRGQRVSNNAPWYQDWYKEYNRAPNKRELQDLAILDAADPDIIAQARAEGIISEEEIAAMEAQTNEILDLQTQRDDLDKLAETFKGLVPGEMTALLPMSPEARELYQEYTNEIKDSKAPAAVKESMKQSALLLARMADSLAEKYRESGKEDVTFDDVKAKLSFGKDVSSSGNKFALNQFFGEASAKRLKERKNKPSAKLWNALTQAKRLEKKGLTADEIYDQTGWTKGIDDEWRYYIPDDINLIDEQMLTSPGKYKMGDLYKNKQLWRVLPELKSVDVDIRPPVDESEGSALGSSDGLTIWLNLDRIKEDVVEAKLTIVHELQHVIQVKDKLAVGGDESTVLFMLATEITNLDKKYGKLKGWKEFAEIQSRLKSRSHIDKMEASMQLDELKATLSETDFSKLTAAQKKIDSKEGLYRKGIAGAVSLFDLYRLLAGEQEARESERLARARYEGKDEGRPHPHAKDGIVFREKDFKQEPPENGIVINGVKYTSGNEVRNKGGALENTIWETLQDNGNNIQDAIEYLEEEIAFADESAKQGGLGWANPTVEKAYKDALNLLRSGRVSVSQRQRSVKEIARILEQRAWHGTAATFDKFDLGYLGTGEGAQAHGWGLYFARDRKISERYKKALSQKYLSFKINGEMRGIDEIRESGTYGENIAANYLEENKGDVKKSLSELRALFESDLVIGEETRAATVEAIDLIENGKITYDESAKGFLYEVEIPDDDVLLIEEETFKNQPTKVRNALTHNVATNIKIGDHAVYLVNNNWQAENGAIVDEYSNEGAVYDAIFAEGGDIEAAREYLKRQDAEKFAAREQILDEINAQGATLNKGYRLRNSAKGMDIYNHLSRTMGDPREASLYLNSIGIKGINYFGGRDGQCYVVFDDAAVSIIERFNQEAGTGTVKGNFDPVSRMINVFKTGDQSTLIHEGAHNYLEVLEEIATMYPDSGAAMEFARIMDWAEWNPDAIKKYEGTAVYEEFLARDKLIREAEAAGEHVEATRLKWVWAQETVARGFEQYLKTGKAPVSGLKDIFRAFKKWLTDIYQIIVGGKKKNQDVGIEITPEIEGFFARMIASDMEIEIAEAEKHASVLADLDPSLLDEKNAEILARWKAEAKEEAKEKLLAQLLKDFRKENTDLHMEAYEKSIRETLMKEKAFQVEAVIESGALNEESAAIAAGYSSVDEYRQDLVKNGGGFEQAVESRLKSEKARFCRNMPDAELLHEMAVEALSSSEYSDRLAALEAQALERRANKYADMPKSVLKAFEKLNESLDTGDASSIRGAYYALKYAHRWEGATREKIEGLQKSIDSLTKELEAAQGNAEAAENARKEAQEQLDAAAKAEKEDREKLKGELKERLDKTLAEAKTQFETRKAEAEKTHDEHIQHLKDKYAEDTQKILKAGRDAQEREAARRTLADKLADAEAAFNDRVMRLVAEEDKAILKDLEKGRESKRKPIDEKLAEIEENYNEQRKRIVEQYNKQEQVRADRAEEREDTARANAQTALDERLAKLEKDYTEAVNKAVSDATERETKLTAPKERKRNKKGEIIPTVQERIEKAKADYEERLAKATKRAAGAKTPNGKSHALKVIDNITKNYQERVTELLKAQKGKDDKLKAKRDKIAQDLEARLASLKEKYEADVNDAQAKYDARIEAIENQTTQDKLDRRHKKFEEDVQKAEESYKASQQSKQEAYDKKVENLNTQYSNEVKRLDDEKTKKSAETRRREIALQDKAKAQKDKIREQNKKSREELVEKHGEQIEKLRQKIQSLKEQLNTNKEWLKGVRDAANASLTAHRQIARERLETMKVHDIMRLRHWQAEAQKADREAARCIANAVRTGKEEEYEKAKTAKIRQQHYEAMLHEAVAMTRKIRSMERNMKKRAKSAATSKDMDASFKYYLSKMLFLYKFTNRNPDKPVTLKGVQEMFDELITRDTSGNVIMGDDMQEIFDEVADNLSFVLQNDGDKAVVSNPHDLDYGTFVNTNALANILWKLGDNNNHLLSFGGKSLIEIIKELIDEFNAHIVKEMADGTHAMNSAVSQLARIEYVMKVLGGEDGKFHRYIYGTLREALTKYHEMDEIKTQECNQIMDNHYDKKEQKMLFADQTVVRVTETGDVEKFSSNTAGQIRKNRLTRHEYTRQEVIAMALNWGNDGNRERLLYGEKLTREQVEKIFETCLTANDWDFVESLWGHLRAYGDDVNLVMERMIGTPLHRVKPDAFTVKTSDGQELTLAGGYYHIKYDAERSAGAAENDVMNANQAMGGASVMGTRMGSTKRRAEKNPKKGPLLLNLGVFLGHCQDQMNIINMKIPVTDVYKIICHPEFENMITNTFGVEMYQNIKRWCEAVWQIPRSQKTFIEKIVGHIRSSMTSAIMGWNFNIAALNGANAAPMAEVMGAGKASQAMAMYLTRPNEWYKFAQEHSIEIRRRFNGQNRDFSVQARAKWSGEKNLRDKWEKAAAKPMEYTDMLTCIPAFTFTYQETYNECLEKGMTVEEAEREAQWQGDKVVRRILGSYDVVDKSAIERSDSEMAKLFTSFYSFFNFMGNEIWSKFYEGRYQGDTVTVTDPNTGEQKQIAAKRSFLRRYAAFRRTFGYRVFGMVAMETAIAMFVASLFGDDDWDDWKDEYAKSYASNLWQSVLAQNPLASIAVQLSSPMWNGYAARSYRLGLLGSAADRVHKAALDVNQLWNGKGKVDAIDAARDFARVANAWTAFPDAWSDASFSTLRFFVDSDYRLANDFREAFFRILFKKYLLPKREAEKLKRKRKEEARKNNK